MARAGQLPLHALTPEQARAAYEVNAGVMVQGSVNRHK
jgi:hypothetical protein